MKVTARLKHVTRTNAKGKDYYYHRPTRTRLPDDPESPEFLVRLEELNRQVEGGDKPGLEYRTGIEYATGFVYFIQAASGPVKIGFSKDNPVGRMTALQISSHEDLTLLGFFPGSMVTEKEVHLKLAAHHIRGEWFKPHPDVMGALTDVSRRHEK